MKRYVVESFGQVHTVAIVRKIFFFVMGVASGSINNHFFSSCTYSIYKQLVNLFAPMFKMTYLSFDATI